MSDTGQFMKEMNGLGTKWAGKDFRYLKVTGSTNDDCVRFMKEGAPHGMVVAAGSQTAGKGRRGRSWSSEGDSVYMTIGLKPEFAPDKASMLTLVMALAACRAVEESLGCVPNADGQKQEQHRARIKWPNDIVIGGRKVCGILTEMRLDGSGIECVVIGVGINVNQTSFDESIAGTATSIFKECGRKTEPELLMKQVLVYFEYYYEKFVEKCDMSTVMGEYVEKLVNKDREVRVLDPQGEYTATALGINEAGELLVRKEDGTTAAVYAGEVSVRGIYGYV